MGYSKDTVAANLRALRAKKRMTQAEVAEALGVHINTVGNYENGDGSMSYEAAWKLADLYGVPLCALGGRDERSMT